MIDFKLLKKYANNISVLLIDDDYEVLESTKDILDTLFSCVDTAKNGEEGINKYQNFFKNNNKYYDLIISDLDMPKIDGISLINAIYELNEKQKIIVMSAHNTSDNLLHLLNIRIDHFIVKPMDADDFLNALFKVLESMVDEHETDLIIINKYLEWNKKSRILYKNNQEIKLTKREMLFVNLILSKPNIHKTVDEILDVVWDDSVNLPEVGNLKNLISRLRKKAPELKISNTYGVGYKILID